MLNQGLQSLILACVIVIVGVLIGMLVQSLINRLFLKLRINDVLIATGANKVVEKSGYRMDTARLVGLFFKWFIILVAIDAAAGVLGISAATVILYALTVAYLPHIIIAAVILFCGFVIAHRMERTLAARTSHAHLPHIGEIARLVRPTILTLATLGILIELHIAYEIALILFCGIVATCALAIGIALGLMGKDVLGSRIDSRAHTKE
jgi:hypothetical protein